MGLTIKASYMERKLVSIGGPYKKIIGLELGSGTIEWQGEIGRGRGQCGADTAMPGNDQNSAWEGGFRVVGCCPYRRKLANIGVWKKTARDRALYFNDTRPVETLVQVPGFIGKDCIIEIVVDAV